MRITLDFSGLESPREMQDYLRRALAFPDHYGANLDALYDMLTAWDRGTRFALRLPASPSGEAARYVPRLLQVFFDAAAANPRVQVSVKG